MRKLDPRKLAREKNLFRYSSALERADFDTVAAVLREAEHDPVLAQMITEINMVYESETLRLSPSLNHSSNHHQKELLMTTIILPRRQSPLQRWLPVTLAAACVSVLFIGALLMRPIRPGGTFESGLQAGSTETPTAAASPTMVPTLLPTFTPSPVAAVNIPDVTALPPTVVPPVGQADVGAVGTPVCGGSKIITEDTFVHGQPSNRSNAIGRVPAGTKVETLLTGNAAEGDTSVPKTQWFFIKAVVDGNSVQGWVNANVALPVDLANPCPSSDVTVFSDAVPVPTLVPAEIAPFATVLPTIVPPVFSAATVPTCSAVTLSGTDIHIVNRVDQAATIYAAPLTDNSNAAVVGEFPARAEATLLYQQYDQASDPIGALWYLIMTGEGENQVTGWVSANSVTADDSCVAIIANPSIATATIGQINTVAVPTLALSTPIAISAPSMCQIMNTTGESIQMFAAPLTANSNAPEVGEFPANSEALVILQNYDGSSDRISALWYLITLSGDNNPLTGWISGSNLYLSDGCATAVNAVSEAVPANAQAQAEAVTAPVEGSGPAVNCMVNTNHNETVPVFSGPNESLVINKLPPDMSATVLYQQFEQETNLSWYLILAVSNDGQQVSGWVTSDRVSIDTTHCPQKP